MDRELEPGTIILEYSTDNGQTFNSCTLVNPGDAANLDSAWHPGKAHSVRWDSVADNFALSGNVTVCVKVTPSDASNPSGTPGISGSFTVNNIAYNEAPTATAATPAGVQTGNVQINYFLADVESDTCTISVLYSTNDGTSWLAATMGPAGDGISGLSSSPSGTAHVYLWDSRADSVAPSGQVDTIRVRITPADFNAGTAGDTNSFSVDNSVANNPPTVTITGGPADGSTVTTTQVTFTWSGSDTDGSVVGYYYSFDQDPPNIWTTDATVTSGVLSEASHIFRVVAVDDDSDLSTVASRTFTVTLTGNEPPTVTITQGPSGTINYDSPTFQWEGSDPDGTVAGYYYSLDNPTPGIWTTGTSRTETGVTEGTHSFYVMAEDDLGAKSSVDSRTFTVDFSSAPELDPVIVGHYSIPTGRNGKVYVEGSYAYVSNREGLYILDVSDPTDIGLVKYCDLIDYVGKVRLEGPYAYCTNTHMSNAVKVLDVSDPASPWVYTRTSGVSFGAINVFLTGTHAYIAGDDLTIIDTTSLPYLDLTGNLTCAARDADVQGDYAYVAAGYTGFKVIDITDKENPSQIANDECGGEVHSVFVRGDYAYVGDWSGPLKVYNISNPSNPQVVCTPDNSDTALDVHVEGQYAFLACRMVGLRILDISTPENATYLKTVDTPDETLGVYAHRAYAYITDEENGLYAVRLFDDGGNQPPSVNITGGPSGTITENTATFTFEGTDPDGGIDCCYVSTKVSPPNIRVAGTSYTTGKLWNGDYTFYVQAQDDGGKLSTVASRTFTVNSGEKVWHKMLGGTENDFCEAVVPMADGGVVCAGYSYSTIDPLVNHGSSDAYVARLDDSGNITWHDMYGGSASELIRGMCATDDGGVVISGKSASGDIPGTTYAGCDDAYAVRLNSSGGAVWQKLYGGSQNEFALAVCRTQDNRYLFSGITTSTDVPGCTDYPMDDGYVLLLDGSGNLSWQKQLGGDSNEEFMAACATGTSSLYVAGYSGSHDIPGCSNNGSVDCWVAKLDADGNVLWQRMFGGGNPDYCYAMCPASDGGVILAGESVSTIPGSDTNATIYVAHVDGSGGLVWQKKMGIDDNDICYGICQCPDGGYLLAAKTNFPFFPGGWTHGDTDLYLVKINAAGELVWERAYGGSGPDVARDVAVATDQGFFVVGHCQSTDIPSCPGFGLTDYYILKLDSEGNKP
jgi:hypothetical protein